MANVVQLNTEVTPAHDELVERIAAEKKWTKSATVRKMIREFAALMILHEGTAEELGGELGEIFMRLVDELGPAQMVNKKLTKASFGDDGQDALVIDEFVFYLDDARLFAAQEVGGRQDFYEVKDGDFVRMGVFGSGDPSMN